MKVNPRKIPRTQADVERAYKAGMDVGTELCLTLVLFTLQDKFGAGDEELAKFSDAFHYTLDSLDKGYVTEADLRRVLKAEYGTEIVVTKEPPRAGTRDGKDNR